MVFKELFRRGQKWTNEHGFIFRAHLLYPGFFKIGFLTIVKLLAYILVIITQQWPEGLAKTDRITSG